MKIPKHIKIYGDQSYRGDCITEAADQKKFMKVIRMTEYGRIAIHIKNEGKRTQGQALFDRAQGMVKGASDIIIPASPAFVCELKRKNHMKSSISTEQIIYLLAAQEKGAFACIALGFEGAIEAFNKWKLLIDTTN